MPDLPNLTKDNIQETVRRRRYSSASSPGALVSLTPVKVRMLQFLVELRFLSLPQLARLCCPATRHDLSKKRARRHLRALFDAGLVNVLAISRAALAPPDAGNDPALLHGSAPNIYAPTAAGLKLLVRAGLAEEDVLRRPLPLYGPRNSLFLAHELAVRDVRVWLETCAESSPGAQSVLEWNDGADAVLKLEQLPRRVLPDAWFVYQLQGGETMRAEQKRTVLVGLVEVDRGTERGERHWREKLSAYQDLYSGSTLQKTTGYAQARVLVICHDEARRDRLTTLIASLGTMSLSLRFWITVSATLEGDSFTSSEWLRCGTPGVHFLVPPGILTR